MKKRKVFGVGINDADYPTRKHKYIEGKRVTVWTCYFYQTWKNMMSRCYSEIFALRQPTYKGCQVCTEWLTFSNFKSWMEVQDYEGKQLDKDLLIDGNKIYSPEVCIFVDSKVNSFISDCAGSRGQFLIGACWDKSCKKFLSCCHNPFTGKQENLGRYDDELSAHKAWKKRKHELACQLADSDLVQDERLAQALRTRYLPDNTQEVKAA